MTADCTPDEEPAASREDATTAGSGQSSPDVPPAVDGKPDADSALDADAAVARIRDHAETVRDREHETALSRLETQGDLSAADRAALAGLAECLVERLTAVPERTLRDAAASDDEETVEAALSLFE